MRGPAYVSSGKLIHDRNLVRSQNLTIRHTWNGIRRNKARAFLIADAVGRGKSYMALGVALGLWRMSRKGTFRIVVLAPTRELSSAWMKNSLGSGR